MARELNIPQKSTKGSVPASADALVDATAPTTDPAEPTRKLSLLVPESDHRATKAGAALRGSAMIDEFLELTRARNRSAEGWKWPADVVASVLAQVVAEGGAWPDAVVASVLAQAEPAPAPAKKAAPARTRRPAAKKAAPAKPSAPAAKTGA